MAKRQKSSPHNNKPLLGAALALIAAAALIGGPVTSASLNDTTSNTIADASGGGLTVEILTSAWQPVSLSSQPSNLVPRGSSGIVPGVRAQKITFTVRNSAGSATPAQLMGVIAAPRNAALQALEGAGLRYEFSSSTGCTAGAFATVGTELQARITSTTPLVSGAACTFALTLSVPCSDTSCEAAAWKLKSQRLTSLPAFTANAALTQAARQS